MQKIALIAFPFLISIIQGYGQKVTLTDIKSFADKQTDEVAEVLLGKGFELNAYPLGKEFKIENGNESLSIDFKDNDPFYTYKFVTICYSAKYNNDFESLVSQIKTQGKKLSFFYSTYHLYVTEYVVKSGLYVYISKGFCESLDHKTKFGSLFISNESIKNKLQ